ncbi:MAG: transcriptional repressor LexA [Planctomycetota bacterium]|nr:transcriptional repressor LexA [Planctomycetota bacterium]
MNLTARQHEIIKFIWKYRKRRGLAPTLAEIASELGISKVTVHEHIAQLEKKGALEKEPFLSRSTRLTRRMLRELERTVEEQSRYVGVEDPPEAGEDDEPDEAPLDSGAQQRSGSMLPLLGEIAAGKPLEAVEQRELVDLADICQLDRANYLLRVKGDSMIEDGICDGDFVLVERRNTARDGETVVAILENNEATLKRFYRQKKRFKLEPANSSLKPIYTEKLEVRGVVVGVIRRCS